MSTPQELDHFINQLQQNKLVRPANDEESLADELFQLANQFDLTSQFDSALLAQFEVQKSTTRIITHRWMRLTASILVGLISISLLIMTVPPLRVLAGEILNELFQRDTESIKVYSDNQGYYAFSDETIGLTSINEIPDLLEYEVTLPDYEAFGYQFERASILQSRNSIQTYYSRVSPPEDNQIGNSTFYTFEDSFLQLRVRQQPLEDSKNGVFHFTDEQGTIAPIAETTPVSVNGYQGQFVQGTWMSSTISGKKHFYWRANTPIYRLRWQDNMFLYEIELWSEPENILDRMLAIAESMME